MARILSSVFLFLAIVGASTCAYGEILQYRGGEWNGDTKSVQTMDGRVKKVPTVRNIYQKKARSGRNVDGFLFQGVPEGMWVEKVEGIPRTINFGRSRKELPRLPKERLGLKAKVIL